MSRRRIFLPVLAIIVVLAVVATLLAPSAPEPEYAGKKLSVWVRDFPPAPPGPHVMLSGAPRAQDAGAVGHIGTNALPYLLKWLACDTPAWKQKFAGSQNALIATLWRLYRRFDQTDAGLQSGSMRALIALGPGAESVIPELSRLASARKPAQSRSYARAVLQQMGQPGYVALIGVLARKEEHGGEWGIDDIHLARHIGDNAWVDRESARLALPVLRRMTQNSDPSVATAGRNALEAIVRDRRSRSVRMQRLRPETVYRPDGIRFEDGTNGRPAMKFWFNEPDTPRVTVPSKDADDDK